MSSATASAAAAHAQIAHIRHSNPLTMTDLTAKNNVFASAASLTVPAASVAHLGKKIAISAFSSITITSGATDIILIGTYPVEASAASTFIMNYTGTSVITYIELQCVEYKTAGTYRWVEVAKLMTAS